MQEIEQNVVFSDKVVNITTAKLPQKIKKPKVYESSVVDACIKWLCAQGLFCWRNNSGAYKPEGGNSYVRYGYPGSSDILAINKQGTLVCIECKSDTGKLTDKQIAFGQKITASNGVYVMARGIDDLERNRAAILGQNFLPSA